jgi:PAS domain S-box-containing protein
MSINSVHSRAVAYAIAILIPVLVSLALVLTWPLFEGNPVNIFLVAVIVSAWFGGFWPGFVAAGTSFVLIDFFFIRPFYSFALPDNDTAIRMMTVAGIGLFISFVCERLGRESRLAEKHLKSVRQSEERFRTTLETLLEGCVIVNHEGRYVYLNEAAARHRGTTVVNLIGRSVREAFPQLQGSDLLEVFEKCMRERVARELESEFTGPDGVPKWLHLLIQPVPEGLFILSLDITERRRVIESIRAREARFRAVAECASDAIVIIDDESTIIYANDSMEKLFGYAPDEVIGRSLTMLMPESFRGKHSAGIERYLQTGKKNTNWERLELTGRHKNGTEIPIEVSFGKFLSDGRKNFAGIIRDISQRKMSEKAIEESEAKLRGIIDSAMDAIITVDKDQRVVLFNKSASEVFRVSADRAIGEKLDRFLPQRFREIHVQHTADFGASDVKSRATASSRKISGLRSDGEEFPLEASISQVQLDGEKLYTVISAT